MADLPEYAYCVMNGPELGAPDIYEEDEDASIEVPFSLASLTTATPPSSPPKASISPPKETSNEEDSESPENQFTDPRHQFESSSELIIDSPAILEHRMWREAAGALRHFGVFSKLPIELQEVVLGFCGPTTLLKIMQINPYGHFVGKQDKLWEKLFFTDYPTGRRLVREQDASWMSNYRSAYYYDHNARILQITNGFSNYNYSHNCIKPLGSTSGWRWNPLTRTITTPSFRTAIWNEESRTLHMFGQVFTIDAKRTRISSISSPMVGTVIPSTSFPHSERVQLYSRHTSAGYIQITGKVPTPLLIAFVFQLQ